jgi:hypothetical protein
MTNYEPLREMGAFTEDMFNRIIAFQEHEHPAWKTELPFDERIKGLPLHNLIFSTPDRDPAQFGPTVAPYYPLREEMQKLAFYLGQLGTDICVADVYPGNGFVGSLLAREGIKVKGLPQPGQKPNQIAEFFDAEHYAYLDGNQAPQHFDAAFISWPPADVNPTPQWTEQNTPLLVYVYTEHVDEDNGRRQTGSDHMFEGLDGYQLVDQWTVLRPKDLLHEIWPDMTPSIEEERHVRIYSKEPLAPAVSLPPTTPYDWEKDLHMALLALQAKREVEARGFPV